MCIAASHLVYEGVNEPSRGSEHLEKSRSRKFKNFTAIINQRITFRVKIIPVIHVIAYITVATFNGFILLVPERFNTVWVVT